MRKSDLEEILRRLQAAEVAQAERSRAAAPHRGRRPPTRSRIAAAQRQRMRTIIARTYVTDPPIPGSLRDVRLGILAMTLRELARRAGVSANSIQRAERGQESGNPNAVSGPTLRAIAAVVERHTGKRTRVDDVRASRNDA